MADRHESLSEQSKRRTSWILSVLGLVVLILFVVVLCSQRKQETQVVQRDDRPSFVVGSTFGDESSIDEKLPSFGVQNAQLVVTPSEVDLAQVVLGSQAEAVLVLRAEKGPLMFSKKYLAVTPEGGFMLSGDCMETTQLEEGAECLLKVSWSPTSVQTIQNTLTIIWREDNPRVLSDERTQIQLKASSTDSKECVCCEVEKQKEPKVPRKVLLADGTEAIVNDDGTVTIDGKTYEVKGEVIIDPETGDVLAIVEPERVALSLNNEYLGRVTDRRTVEDKEGKILGRLLGDDTLVDPDFNILGAAVPLVSVLDAQGVVIGKMVADDDGVRVVDGEGKVIGTPRVDKSIVDKAGVQIGMLRDWGATLDLSGNYMGVILPNAAVIGKEQKVLGYIQQNGFVTSDTGVLVGGVVPKGAAVGTGCRSYGTVALTGQVKDAYGQVVGRVLLDNAVVDTNFNEIGAVVNQGLIVNMKGDVVGFVNSEGKAVDGKGNLMGCVSPNGMVAAGKNIVGGVLQKGYVTGESCGVVGSVYPDARVMSSDVREVGKVRADAYVIDANGKRIGAVVPHGTVLAGECRLLGVISVTGQVLNQQNMSVGCVTMQKKVIDSDGREVGTITPTGPVLATDGSLIGRARYDGRVVDKNGKEIDCVNPEEPSIGAKRGVVLDENGLPTGWTALAGKCYNERNEEVGNIAFNGWVSDKEGKLVGFMPSDGVVFGFEGAVLGTYNQLIGTVVDTKGDSLGRVMPDGTVLDSEGKHILGSLLPQDATFVALDGSVLGVLNYDGRLLNDLGQVVGRVLSDGSVYNTENALLGGIIRSGVVLSANGTEVGFANSKGDVLSKGTRIANLLPNGLAVTPDNRVLGHLWDEMSVVVSAGGVVGSVVPRATSGDNSTYQAAVYDKNAAYVGALSGYGVLLNSDGRLGGVSIPVTMVFDMKHQLIGWVGFKGLVVNSEGQIIGQLMPNGLVTNATGSVIGTVLRRGTVVNRGGSYIGRIAADGGVYNGSGATGLFEGPHAYIFSEDMSVNAHILEDGLAINSSGQVLGWTGFSGQIMNSESVVGLVGLDNRVTDVENRIVASYVPLGAPTVQENEKMCAVIAENGTAVSAGGKAIGSVIAPDYVVQNNAIVGRVRSNSLFVRNLTNSDLAGIADLDGLVYRPSTARQVGTMMMNGFVVDSAKKVIAGLVDTGFAVSNNLKSLGWEDYTGSVWLGGKIIGSSSSAGIVSQENTLSGGIFEPAVIVDRNGLEIGFTDALSAVIDKSGKKIASRMAFHSALTPETFWAGGPIRTGAVIDDYARKIGTVAGDGLVMSSGALRGRVLPDGSVAGVAQRSIYNPMPYAGHLTTQGLPMGYNETVLGRTTVQGDLIDASDKIIYQTLDDGTILGKERPLEGMILTFRPAVSYHDAVLGMIDGDGKIMADGEAIGRVATNGAIVSNLSIDGTAVSKLKEEGGLIPESLIVSNSCSVIGQPTYTGEVIDGQGNTVGRVQPTLMALDVQGKELGHSVRYGPITSFDSRGLFIGRSMPDSTVVDPDGVNIGCARIDKILVDANGNELGRLRDRGPVFDAERKMVGRVDAMGRVVGLTGEVIGVIGGRDKDIWYDLNGNEKGWMATKEDRLIFNPDGTLDKAVSRDGWVRDGNGEILYRIDQKTGKLYDKFGNEIGRLGDSMDYVFLYDMQDKIVARLTGCDLQKIPGNEKMGSLLANGDIRDPNDELILTTTADGKVYNPDGTQYGRFAGVGLDLRRCGLASANLGGSGRTISWGTKKLTVEPSGMITDDKGRVVGGWDAVNNRPYIWDVESNEDIGRGPPPEPQIAKIPDEVKATFSDLQKKRRRQMREKMSETPVIIPGEEILARAKGRRDEDWSSVGVSKSNISSWPVDMSRVLLKDKAVPAVLVHSIDSRYPDVPVTAIVERHIYAEEGRNILIPAGSRLIGRLEGAGLDFGRDQAAKISISWERLIRPDGAAFKFVAVSGDAQGRGGVAAYLDLQLMKKFMLPFVSTMGEGAILKATELLERHDTSKSSASAALQEGGTTGNADSQIRGMFIQNFRDVWGELMEMAGDIPNVVYVPSGTRLTAYSNEDLWLRSWKDDEDAINDKFGKSLSAMLPSSNGSWVKGRKGEDRNTEPSANRPSEQAGASVETPVYAPADINDRIVEPVARQPEPQPTYF